MAKYILNTAPDFDFDVIGLSCGFNEYRMVHELNTLLNIELIFDEHLDLIHRTGKNFAFSLYTFSDEDFNLEYHLLPNRSNIKQGEKGDVRPDLFSNLPGAVEEGTRLLPELEKTDFLLLLKGDERETALELAIKRLEEAEYIVAVQRIIPAKLPSRNNLLF